MQRYTAIESHDPRAWRDLGTTYEDAKQFEEAAAAYRKAIEIDPAETVYYSKLIQLLLVYELPGDVRELLVAGEKYQDADEDLFGSIVQRLSYRKDTKAAEKLAAAEPLRMKTSALANLSLGEMLTADRRYLQAERSLNTALQINKRSPATEKKSVNVYVALAELYRKQSRWLAALKAADQGIALDDSDSDAYFQRVCALARLRRFNEAIAALSKSIDLPPLNPTTSPTNPTSNPSLIYPPSRSSCHPQKSNRSL